MLEPFEWNVVVAGAWNRAILTPNWIKRRMFRREDALVEVQVPLDMAGPLRVVFEQIVVQAGGPALIVLPEACTLAALTKAATIAANAVDSLPETPLSGCGINLRYRITGTSALQRLNQSTIDAGAISAGFHVQARQVQRTLKCEDADLNAGVINMVVGEDENGESSLVLNFHLSSIESIAIKQWLQLSEDTLRTTASALLQAYLEIEEEIV